MTKEEFKACRESMRYSLADLSVLLGIAKSTLARYEDGTATVKPELAERMLKEQARAEDFRERTRQDTREWCNKVFPQGIPANYNGRI
jgi:predicted transcriptional regulator